MANDALTRAYGLTKELESVALQGDWTRAASLVEACSPLFRQLAPEQSAEALDMIREIHRINASVMQRAHASRDELAARQNEAISKIEAARQYQITGIMSARSR
ncbi:flagellar protein FliT [Paraburkholderia phymatum]|uniref:flagellar protein FliT n=1 Tax=Paraburkholderia phymatum TaxID=148447 RepID=UPI00317D3048